MSEKDEIVRQEIRSLYVGWAKWLFTFIETNVDYYLNLINTQLKNKGTT